MLAKTWHKGNVLSIIASIISKYSGTPLSAARERRGLPGLFFLLSQSYTFRAFLCHGSATR